MIDKRIRTIWKDINRRCKSDGDRSKKWPTYKSSTCDFEDLADFADWANVQPGFHMRDGDGNSYQLDKDIIIAGNKAYSREACCFVPARINTILTSCIGARGAWPVGVSWNIRDRKFASKIRINGVRRYLGYFDDPLQAHAAWQEAKAQEIRNAVASYESSLGVDVRVVDALLKRADGIDSDRAQGLETMEQQPCA
ncbi:hypothetical protein AB4P95_11505 [Pseudomonas sp. A1437]|uniref:hypothetical protein n=1 Tax=unclassified Pseudomonas TaxID=196821 RepID=UPI003783A221